MQKFYEIDLMGRKEHLPILNLKKDINVAFFNLHGNQVLTEYCAKLLADLVRGCDVILTAESKGLQLAHCVAKNLRHEFYAVARKSLKLYMVDGINVDINSSITTGAKQKLYLSLHDKNLMKDKKIAIIDDVISTGNSLVGLEKLVELSGGTVFKKAFVLAEGKAVERKDIEFISSLPLF